MPTFLHELVVIWLGALLRTWAIPRSGQVVGSETKLAIAKDRGRKPDLSVFLGGAARPRLLDSVVRVAPHVVIEVVSARPRDARRDRVDKLRDYAKAGARYYWLLDPQLRTLEILELEPARRYAHALAATGGRLDDVPGCEGLVIDLDALWTEIDQGAAAEEVAPPKKRP
jgi:Uma2 family endonuclease